jgi:hypothetical protein
MEELATCICGGEIKRYSNEDFLSVWFHVGTGSTYCRLQKAIPAGMSVTRRTDG